MKNDLLPLLGLVVLAFACTEERMNPVADFTFRNETGTTLAMGTYDTCTLVNRSLNATIVNWNFGDGRLSTDQSVVLSYDKAGTYDVTLTVRGEDGRETTISKSVVVKDRVLRSIDISKVYWNLDENGWPPTTEAEVYLQIQLYTDIEMAEGNLCASCPVVFTSNKVGDVANSAHAPFSIQVNEKVIIDKKMIRFARPENVNKAYLISLMAKDKDGNNYCLQSNRGGGTYFGILREDFVKNEFIIQNGPFSDYKLVCEFE